MEKGDILTLVAGVIMVLVIALATNPSYLSGLSSPEKTPVATPSPSLAATPASTPLPVTVRTPAMPTPVPPIAPPERIVYTTDPFSYPRFKLPENMGTFGASDLTLRGREMVTFAYISESRGGLTQKFTVPYPVWIINTTVIANRTPQYGNFRMVLCYANNGSVIDGEEILNRGSMIRVIETAGTEMYMIVTTANIDSYRMDFETPRDYYDKYRPA